MPHIHKEKLEICQHVTSWIWNTRILTDYVTNSPHMEFKVINFGI